MKENYDFEGWYTSSTDGIKITDSSIVALSAEQILYARWKFVGYVNDFTLSNWQQYTYINNSSSPITVDVNVYSVTALSDQYCNCYIQVFYVRASDGNYALQNEKILIPGRTLNTTYTINPNGGKLWIWVQENCTAKLTVDIAN